MVMPVTFVFLVFSTYMQLQILLFSWSFWSIWFHLIYISYEYLTVPVCWLHPSQNPVLSWIYSYFNDLFPLKRIRNRSKKPNSDFFKLWNNYLHVSHDYWKQQAYVSEDAPLGQREQGLPQAHRPGEVLVIQCLRLNFAHSVLLILS